MKNCYEFKGNTVVIFVKWRDQPLEALIDLEDLEKVIRFPNTWAVSKRRDLYYVRMNYTENGIRKTAYLHKLILGETIGKVIDHRNGNALDNQKHNLRKITVGQNNQNRVHRQKNNTSGIRNVSWDKSRKKWCVEIQVNGKSKHMGRFANLFEAEEVAINARRKYMEYSTV